MKKETLAYGIVIGILLMSNVVYYTNYKQSQDDNSEMSAAWETAQSQRDECRVTLEKVTSKTVAIINKDFATADEMAGYSSEISKILRDAGLIVADAK